MRVPEVVNVCVPGMVNHCVLKRGGVVQTTAGDGAHGAAVPRARQHAAAAAALPALLRRRTRGKQQQPGAAHTHAQERQDAQDAHDAFLAVQRCARHARSLTAAKKLRILTFKGLARGGREWPLNDGQIPNVRGVRVHASTGYNRVGG